MRPFIPYEVPRAFDPTLVKILRDVSAYLEQVDKGFGKISRGEVPTGGTVPLPAGVASHHLLTDLNSHDDHTIHPLLAGRTGGQTLYGTPPSSLSASWTNAGNFVSEQSKAAGSTWTPITIDTSAAIGDIIILVLTTLPFSSNIDADTTHHSSITDTKGNTWTRKKEHSYSPDTFSNGSTMSVWTCIVTAAMTAGVDTLTATYDASIGAMAISSHRYTGGAGAVNIAAYAQVSDFLLDPSPLSVSAARDNYLFIRATSQGQGGATVIGNYGASTGFTAFDHADSKTIGGTGNVGSFGEYQIGLTSGASTDPSSTASSPYFNSILVALTIPAASAGDLVLASQNHSLAAKIHLHNSEMKMYADRIGFYKAGGASELSYIDGNTGAFVGPVSSTNPPPPRFARLFMLMGG